MHHVGFDHEKNYSPDIVHCVGNPSAAPAADTVIPNSATWISATGAAHRLPSHELLLPL